MNLHTSIYTFWIGHTTGLLRQVQAGKRFTITNRGKPVAELGPPTTSPRPDAKAAIEAFQAYRKANPVGRKVNIKALIEEGRE